MGMGSKIIPRNRFISDHSSATLFFKRREGKISPHAWHLVPIKNASVIAACNECIRILMARPPITDTPDNIFFGVRKIRPLSGISDAEKFGIEKTTTPTAALQSFRGFHNIQRYMSHHKITDLLGIISKDMEGFARMLVTSYFFEEGYMDEEAWGFHYDTQMISRSVYTTIAARFLQEQDTAPLATDIKKGPMYPDHFFPANERVMLADIRALPHLAVRNPDWDVEKLFRKLLSSKQFDVIAFQKAKFIALLKLVMHPSEHFEVLGKAFFPAKDELKDKFVTHFQNRQRILRAVLLNMLEFRAFMFGPDINHIKKSIIEEFELYNENLRSSKKDLAKDSESVLTIDVESASDKFDQLDQEVKDRGKAEIADCLYTIFTDYIDAQILHLQKKGSIKKKEVFALLARKMVAAKQMFKEKEMDGKKRFLSQIISEIASTAAHRRKGFFTTVATLTDWQALVEQHHPLFEALALKAPEEVDKQIYKDLREQRHTVFK